MDPAALTGSPWLVTVARHSGSSQWFVTVVRHSGSHRLETGATVPPVVSWTQRAGHDHRL